MSEASPVRIKVATVSDPTINTEKPHLSTARVTFTTEDEYRIEFDLEVVALALLVLTANPVLHSLKAASEANK